MKTAQDIRFGSVVEAMSVKETVLKATEALRVMSLLARELARTGDFRSHKLAGLKTSLKSFRDLISGVKLLAQDGLSVEISELFFGNPTTFTQILDSEDHSFGWILKVKNLLGVGVHNVSTMHEAVEKKVSELMEKNDEQAVPTVVSVRKLARRKEFEENVGIAPKMSA